MAEDAASGADAIDVFVSYSTADATDDAMGLVSDIERRGIRCWVAPRDIPHAAIWPVEIQKAIRFGQGLPFGPVARRQRQRRDHQGGQRAARHKKPLFVARTEDIQPADGWGTT